MEPAASTTEPGTGQNGADRSTRAEEYGDEESLEYNYTELKHGHSSADIEEKIRSYRLLTDFLIDRVPSSAPASAED